VVYSSDLPRTWSGAARDVSATPRIGSGGNSDRL